MKCFWPYFGLLLGGLAMKLSIGHAAEVVAFSLDGGGGLVASDEYELIGHLGGIVGVSDVSVPAQIARHGYIGQLTDVVGLSLSANPDSVDEEATTQLSGQAILDDLTVTSLSGSAILWDVPSWPLAAIDGNGLATASAVYTDTLALFSGSYLDIADTGSVWVIDVDPDNFGAYAGDGLPDDWQVFYFGIDNPDAAPDADPTGTQQNNLFRFVAGLNPTNANEVFTFRIAPVPDETDQADLIYDPVRPGRVYSIRATPDLTNPDWQPVASLGTPVTNLQAVTVRDLDATETPKLYHILISLP